MTTPTGWDLVAQQRITFADMIEGLEDHKTDSTLCGHWTVHQVAAHLLTFTNMSLPQFMGNLLKNRFDYDTMADRIATRFAAEKSLAEIAADLRANAAKQSALPGFPAELTLSDITIHRQDIRRPLGLGVDLDEGVAQQVLEFMTTHKQAKNLFDPKRLTGLQLTATDLDWNYGSGAAVEGTGEAIILALTGRRVEADLTGDGVSALLP
jgi:uncharacterized protein (TIGR03083 family)